MSFSRAGATNNSNNNNSTNSNNNNGSGDSSQHPQHGRRAVPAAGANYPQAPRPPQRGSSLRSSVNASPAGGAASAGGAHSSNAATGNNSGDTPRGAAAAAAAGRRGSGSAPGFAAATFASSVNARRAASNSNSKPRSGGDKHAAGDDDDDCGGSDDEDGEEQPGPFWVAVAESKIYTAPNGAAVGEAVAGTVIEEYRTFTDMFGATWIASQAQDETLVWVRQYERGESVGLPRATLWKPWKQEDGEGRGGAASFSSSATAPASAPVAATSMEAQAAKPDPASIICNPAQAPLKLGNSDPAALDFALILQYWKSVVTAKKSASSAGTAIHAAVAVSRDWNTEYQNLVERLLFETGPASSGGATSSSSSSAVVVATNESGDDADAEKRADDIRVEINMLYTEFAQEIESAVSTIVTELPVPQAQRRIKGFVNSDSGSVVLGTYFHNGIMYRINLDTNGSGLGDKIAMKIASQAFKAHSFVGTVAPLFFLHQPLIMVMTYRGFRLTASTIPPLRAESCTANNSNNSGANGMIIAGSPNGGKSFMKPDGGFMATIFDECMEALGLAPHQIKAIPYQKAGLSSPTTTTTTTTSSSPSLALQSITTSFPADSVIIAGWDNRLYWLNTGRVLPPVAPLKNHGEYAGTSSSSSAVAGGGDGPTSAATSGLFWRLRPELVSRLTFRLSSDAFVHNASHVEDNEDVIAATSVLRDDAVPSVAAVLGFLEPPQAPTLSLAACAGCKKPVEGHIVFSICQRECCKICPQCYLEIAKTAFWEEQVDAAVLRVKQIVESSCCRKKAPKAKDGRDAPEGEEDTFSTAAASAVGVPRTLKGFVMTPDVTTLMHAHGVNLRYLSLVYQRIPRSAFHCTAHLLEIEMICRTAKHQLSALLRRAPDTDTANRDTAHFFLALLQPTGEKAEKFWAEELGPAIMKKFDVTAPFDTAALDRDLVYQRLSELTGVQFSAASVKSLLTDKPFVQMLPPRPVLKQIMIPHLVEKAGGRRDYLDRYGGLMQVFWSDMAETEADAKTWESRRPFHMKSI